MIEAMIQRYESRKQSQLYYGMARDCLERARLFIGNVPWFLEELQMANDFRELGRKWRKMGAIK